MMKWLALTLTIMVTALTSQRGYSQDQAVARVHRQILATTPILSFQKTNEYAQEILAKCPPKKCVLLSLGVSNTLLDAFLRYHMRKQNIATAYMRYAPLQRLTALANWKTENSDLLLARIFPSNDDGRGKTVMMLRTLDLGLSMLKFYPVVEGYIKRQNPTWKLGAFFNVANEEFTDLYPLLTEHKDWDVHLKRRGREIDIYKSQRVIDRDFYRYQPQTLTHSQNPEAYELQTNPAYLHLDSLIQVFMENPSAIVALAPRVVTNPFHEVLHQDCASLLEADVSF